MAYSAYSTIALGNLYSPEYVMYITRNAHVISAVHDIPLLKNENELLFHMVVEVQKWSNAQMEVSLGDMLNPVRQVVENGQLKFPTNARPYNGYPWNCGILPQTWQDPRFLFRGVKLMGNSRPIEVIEIGDIVARQGEVLLVKILGGIGRVANGHIDFKVIAIDVRDPLAEHLNEIPDLKRHCGGLLESIYDWLRFFDVPVGAPPNKFAFFEAWSCTTYTYNIVCDAHECWEQMLLSEFPREISRTNTTLEGSEHLIPPVDLYELFSRVGLM